MMPYIKEDNFYVGAWLVQPHLNRIEKQGHVVQIEPKMMQVLAYLAVHAGEVCTRQALLDAGWPDTVVGDEVLSRVISELRKAFGDDARAPGFIETIPRVGYRLIARVVAAGEHDAGRPAESALVEARRDSARGTFDASGGGRKGRKRQSRWFWNVALLVVGMGITGLIVHLQAPDASLSVLSTLPLTSLPGMEIAPALSPDGNRVAFVWTGPENRHMDVFSKGLGTEALLQLTATLHYEYSPVWSPDGNHIAFARALQGIFIIPALGGPERKVADIGMASVPDLAWSPAENLLVFTDRESPNSPYRLKRLNLATGEVTTLTHPPAAHLGDTDPAVSPDGAWIAFARQSNRSAEVYVMPTAGGTPRRLTGDHADLAGLTWTADGTAVVFSSDRGGTYGLWRVAVKGGEAPELLPYGSTDLKEPVIQADRLAFVQVIREDNIWHQNLSTPNEPATPLLVSTREDTDPQFAPDGQSLAFVSSRSGYTEIWKSRADGTGVVQLTHIEGPQVSTPRWAPDGQHLVFDARLHGQPDVFVVSAEGGALRRLTSHDALDVLPSWSRDGSWIYFSSNRSGRWEVWKVAATGEEDAVQVTREGGFVALEGYDGETLFFSRRERGGLWKMPAAGGTPELITDALSSGDWGNWDVTPEALYFVQRNEGTLAVMRYDLADQTMAPAGSLPGPLVRERVSLAVAPDGSTLAFAQTDLLRFDLTVAKLDER